MIVTTHYMFIIALSRYLLLSSDCYPNILTDLSIGESPTNNHRLRKTILAGLPPRDTQEWNLIPSKKPAGLLGTVEVLGIDNLAATTCFPSRGTQKQDLIPEEGSRIARCLESSWDR